MRTIIDEEEDKVTHSHRSDQKMEYEYSYQRESVRDRLKSAVCFCFHNSEAAETEAMTKTPSPRSPFTWLRATAHELEIKDKCKYLVARIGKGSGWRHHRSATEFGYDPMSYALNFEDESSRVDEMPILSFSARLPATPPRIAKENSNAAVARRIVACS